MHYTTNDKPADGATSKMQASSFVHAQMPNQPPFREKVRGQLNTASKTCPHHGCPNTSIQTPDTFVVVDFPKPIHSVLVSVLGANGQEGGIRLQTSFDQEERRTCRSTKDARSCPGKNVDSQRLDVGIFEDGCRYSLPKRFIEAQSTAIENHLVYILENSSVMIVYELPLILTAAPMPRNNPFKPSFFKMTPTPWKTPLYNRGASFFDCNSPCSCKLHVQLNQPFPALSNISVNPYRILTVSKPWVTVTAPHAAMPPAINAL